MGVTTLIKDYGTDILNAIRENDLPRLRSILDKHLKASNKIQKLCISDIKHRPTKKFACPLILAARQEDPQIMRYMMDHGVDPNFVHHTIFSSKRREIVTGLHIAVDLGHYDTVQVLLDANADCNIGDHNQETPLHIAIKKADRVMSRMLLSKGGDPAIPDRRGNAALHIATLYGHLQLVRSLLKYDADVYQKGQWGAIAPHIAAKEGHIHLIQLFCSRDVGNINIKIPCYPDKREKAPIHLAAENGHVETVLALLDQFDAEVNLKDSDGNTPLHCVVLNPYNPHRMRDKEYFNETAKVLLKFGVSVNSKNNYSDTALHLAAMNQFQRIVELLLEVGANPFIENDERLKPIDVVPDFDPVTKQVLKNGMLNPRPALTASRDTLASKSMMSITPSHSQLSIHKRGLNKSGSVSSSVLGSMERSKSVGSFISQSTMSVSSSVFDDALREGKLIMPPPPQSHRHKHPDKHHDKHPDNVYNEIENDRNALYSQVQKQQRMKKSAQQQTDNRRVQTTGTQHEEDRRYMVVQDDTTQTRHVPVADSQTMTQQLKQIVNKQRQNMQHYEDDTLSEIMSTGPESPYIPMAPKERRPKPVPRPSKTPTSERASSVASSEVRDDDSILYENLDDAAELARQRQSNRTPSDSGSQKKYTTSTMPEQSVSVPGIPGGIRVNAGKPGTIELHGYGGAPITIQFDTATSTFRTTGADSDVITINPNTDGSIDDSFTTETPTTVEMNEQYGRDSGHYMSHDLAASMESLDVESNSTMMSETQPELVRNAIKQKIVEVTEVPEYSYKQKKKQPAVSTPVHQEQRGRASPQGGPAEKEGFGQSQGYPGRQQTAEQYDDQQQAGSKQYTIYRDQQPSGYTQPHLPVQKPKAVQQPRKSPSPQHQYEQYDEEVAAQFGDGEPYQQSEQPWQQDQQPHQWGQQHQQQQQQQYRPTPTQRPAPAKRNQQASNQQQRQQQQQQQAQQYDQHEYLHQQQLQQEKEQQQQQQQQPQPQYDMNELRDYETPPSSRQKPQVRVQPQLPQSQQPPPSQQSTQDPRYYEQHETEEPQKPDDSPGVRTFSQAMAFAKSQETKAIVEATIMEHSPYSQRKKYGKPSATYSQDERAHSPYQQRHPAVHQHDNIPTTSSMVSTPEATRWRVQPGGAAVVENTQNQWSKPIDGVTSSAYIDSAQVAMTIEQVEREDDESEEDDSDEEMEPYNPANHGQFYTIAQGADEHHSGKSTPNNVHEVPIMRINDVHSRADQAQLKELPHFQVSGPTAFIDDGEVEPLGQEESETKETVSDVRVKVTEVTETIKFVLDTGEGSTGEGKEDGLGGKISEGSESGMLRPKHSKNLSLNDLENKRTSTEHVEQQHQQVWSPKKFRFDKDGLLEPIPPGEENRPGGHSPFDRLSGCQSPDSILSDTSSRRARLNMRVTGEVPKAYNRHMKDDARRAFIKHKPEGFESNSEASDADMSFDENSPPRGPKSSFDDEAKAIYADTPFSPKLSTKPVKEDRKPETSEAKESGSINVQLLAAVPKPYKSFGKIEPKIDAILDALEEADIKELQSDLEQVESSDNESDADQDHSINQTVIENKIIEDVKAIPETEPKVEVGNDSETTVKPRIQGRTPRGQIPKHLLLQQQVLQEQSRTITETAQENEEEDEDDGEESESESESESETDEDKKDESESESESETESDDEEHEYEIDPVDPGEFTFEGLKSTKKPRPKLDPSKVPPQSPSPTTVQRFSPSTVQPASKKKLPISQRRHHGAQSPFRKGLKISAPIMEVLEEAEEGDRNSLKRKSSVKRSKSDASKHRHSKTEGSKKKSQKDSKEKSLKNDEMYERLPEEQEPKVLLQAGLKTEGDQTGEVGIIPGIHSATAQQTNRMVNVERYTTTNIMKDDGVVVKARKTELVTVQHTTSGMETLHTTTVVEGTPTEVAQVVELVQVNDGKASQIHQAPRHHKSSESDHERVRTHSSASTASVSDDSELPAGHRGTVIEVKLDPTKMKGQDVRSASEPQDGIRLDQEHDPEIQDARNSLLRPDKQVGSQSTLEKRRSQEQVEEEAMDDEVANINIAAAERKKLRKSKRKSGSDSNQFEQPSMEADQAEDSSPLDTSPISGATTPSERGTPLYDKYGRLIECDYYGRPMKPGMTMLWDQLGRPIVIDYGIPESAAITLEVRAKAMAQLRNPKDVPECGMAVIGHTHEETFLTQEQATGTSTQSEASLRQQAILKAHAAKSDGSYQPSLESQQDQMQQRHGQVSDGVNLTEQSTVANEPHPQQGQDGQDVNQAKVQSRPVIRRKKKPKPVVDEDAQIQLTDEELLELHEITKGNEPVLIDPEIQAMVTGGQGQAGARGTYQVTGDQGQAGARGTYQVAGDQGQAGARGTYQVAPGSQSNVPDPNLQTGVRQTYQVPKDAGVQQTGHHPDRMKGRSQSPAHIGSVSDHELMDSSMDSESGKSKKKSGFLSFSSMRKKKDKKDKRKGADLNLSMSSASSLDEIEPAEYTTPYRSPSISSMDSNTLSPTSPQGIEGTVMGAPVGSSIERRDTVKKGKAGFFNIGSSKKKKDKDRAKKTDSARSSTYTGPKVDESIYLQGLQQLQAPSQPISMNLIPLSPTDSDKNVSSGKENAPPAQPDESLYLQGLQQMQAPATTIKLIPIRPSKDTEHAEPESIPQKMEGTPGQRPLSDNPMAEWHDEYGEERGTPSGMEQFGEPPMIIGGPPGEDPAVSPPKKEKKKKKSKSKKSKKDSTKKSRGSHVSEESVEVLQHPTDISNNQYPIQEQVPGVQPLPVMTSDMIPGADKQRSYTQYTEDSFPVSKETNIDADVTVPSKPRVQGRTPRGQVPKHLLMQQKVMQGQQPNQNQMQPQMNEGQYPNQGQMTGQVGGQQRLSGPDSMSQYPHNTHGAPASEQVWQQTTLPTQGQAAHAHVTKETNIDDDLPSVSSAIHPDQQSYGVSATTYPHPQARDMPPGQRGSHSDMPEHHAIHGGNQPSLENMGPGQRDSHPQVDQIYPPHMQAPLSGDPNIPHGQNIGQRMSNQDYLSDAHPGTDQMYPHMHDPSNVQTMVPGQRASHPGHPSAHPGTDQMYPHMHDPSSVQTMVPGQRSSHPGHPSTHLGTDQMYPQMHDPSNVQTIVPGQRSSHPGHPSAHPGTDQMYPHMHDPSNVQTMVPGQRASHPGHPSEQPPSHPSISHQEDLAGQPDQQQMQTGHHPVQGRQPAMQYTRYYDQNIKETDIDDDLALDDRQIPQQSVHSGEIGAMHEEGQGTAVHGVYPPSYHAVTGQQSAPQSRETNIDDDLPAGKPKKPAKPTKPKPALKPKPKHLMEPNADAVGYNIGNDAQYPEHPHVGHNQGMPHGGPAVPHASSEWPQQKGEQPAGLEDNLDVQQAQGPTRQRWGQNVPPTGQLPLLAGQDQNMPQTLDEQHQQQLLPGTDQAGEGKRKSKKKSSKGKKSRRSKDSASDVPLSPRAPTLQDAAFVGITSGLEQEKARRLVEQQQDSEHQNQLELMNQLNQEHMRHAKAPDGSIDVSKYMLYQKPDEAGHHPDQMNQQHLQRPRSEDDPTRVAGLWKEHKDHEAEMQRLLESMSDDNILSGEESLNQSGGFPQTERLPPEGKPDAKPSWGSHKKQKRALIEGPTHAPYSSSADAGVDDAAFAGSVQQQQLMMQQQQIQAAQASGQASLIKPQPVYASASSPPQWGAKTQPASGQYQSQHPADASGARDGEAGPAEHPVNFARRAGIRGKKKAKRQPGAGHGATSDTETFSKRRRGPPSVDEAGIHSEAEAMDMDRVPPKSFDDLAFSAITNQLKDQPKLKPRQPVWAQMERQINFTRGVYRPQPGPYQFVSSEPAAATSQYDDSALVSKLWGQQHPAPQTESEAEPEIDEGVQESPPNSVSGYDPNYGDNYNTGSAFTPVAPGPKKVTIVEEKRGKKKKRKKDKPRILEPGPVDFSQYPPAAQIWMEQVDQKTVAKSRSMYMTVLPEDTRMPAELVKSMPQYEMASDDVFLPPQWVVARGRSLRKRNQMSTTSMTSMKSESEFELSPERPMSPGRQMLLFFRIGNNWRDLAWVLFDGLLNDTETMRMIRDIQLKHPGQIREQVQDMMRRWWKKKGPSATIEELQRALHLINLSYIQEDFLDPKRSVTTYTDTEDDLDVSEISDTDPDVSRIMGEYEVRSLNSSFECDPNQQGTRTRSQYSINSEIIMNKLRDKNLHSSRSSRMDSSRDTLGGRQSHDYSFGRRSPSGRRSPYYHDTSHTSLDETFDNQRFIIVQPQLKNTSYRHETTI